MQPARAEFFFALDVTALADGFQGTVDELPLGWLALGIAPVLIGFFAAVEKDFGIGRCLGCLGIVRLGGHDFRLRLFGWVGLVYLDSVDKHVFDFFPFIIQPGLFFDHGGTGGYRDGEAGEQREC